MIKNILQQYSKLNPISLDLVFAEEFLPAPDESDYELGYITRYFVRRVNGSSIIEVNLENYESISNDLYERVDLRWEISGSKNNIYFKGKIQSSGVEERNLKSIKLASKSMSGIENKLIKPSQFHKE